MFFLLINEEKQKKAKKKKISKMNKKTRVQFRINIILDQRADAAAPPDALLLLLLLLLLLFPPVFFCSANNCFSRILNQIENLKFRFFLLQINFTLQHHVAVALATTNLCCLPFRTMLDLCPFDFLNSFLEQDH